MKKNSGELRQIKRRLFQRSPVIFCERIPSGVIPHSKVGNKTERGIGKTHGAATLNGP